MYVAGAADAYTDFVQPKLGLSNGKRYVVSVWARPSNGLANPLTDPIGALAYSTDALRVTGATVIADNSDKQAINGWHRQELVIQPGAGPITLSLRQGMYYDDIRVFPEDGSLQAYVYDPDNYRLRATLDENNYATLYQYDDQGILIGTLKETERGIRTIQETRSYTNQKDGKTTR